MKLSQGLRAGHNEQESSEALVGDGDKPVTAILAALPALRAGRGPASHRCPVAISVPTWKMGRVTPAHPLEAQITAVTLGQDPPLFRNTAPHCHPRPWCSLTPWTRLQHLPPFPSPHSGRKEVCSHWQDGRHRVEAAVLKKPKPRGQWPPPSRSNGPAGPGRGSPLSGCPVLGVHTRAVFNVPIYPSQPVVKAILPPQWNGTFQLKSDERTQTSYRLLEVWGQGDCRRQSPA